MGRRDNICPHKEHCDCFLPRCLGVQICLIIIVNVTSSDLFVVTSQVTMLQYLHIHIMPLLLSGHLPVRSPAQYEQMPGGQSGIILTRTNGSPGSRSIRPMAARVKILSIPVCAGQNTKPARNIAMESCGTRIPAGATKIRHVQRQDFSGIFLT